MDIEIRNMSKQFGGLLALDDVSVLARSGEVTAVIGPNGAGKSTLINCITGVIRPDRGAIFIDGIEQPPTTPRNLLDRGISRTFQNLRLWDHLTCHEHVALARMNAVALPRLRGPKGSERGSATVDRLLARLGLSDKAQVRPAELSYGEKRRLEIARALATSPRLLLLDEPAAGFNLSEQSALGDLVQDIVCEGIAVILIEHHMDLVAKVSKRVTVLNFGRTLMTGTIAEARSNPEVISAYLGVSA